MSKAHDILGKVRTVVFVGAPFAGKSTLINCLLDREDDGTGPAAEAAGRRRRPAEAEEGQRGREAGVEAFAVELQKGDEVVPVMLVEVPGSWEAERPWDQLVHVADLVVVVVSFAGETARQAEKLAVGARRLGRCANVLVVVNGMDRVLHGNPKSKVWTKYDSNFLTELQVKFARSAKVGEGKVLMSVAIPDESLEPTTYQNLQNLSKHVQFQNKITTTLQDVILGLPGHHHCWGPSHQISPHP